MVDLEHVSSYQMHISRGSTSAVLCTHVHETSIRVGGKKRESRGAAERGEQEQHRVHHEP